MTDKATIADCRLSIADLTARDRKERIPARAASACRSIGNWQLKIGNSRRRGLTLLEVLLAVSLTVALAAGVYSFYDFVLRTRTNVREAQRQIFAYQRILDTLDAEIGSMVDYGMLMTANGSTGPTGDAESIGFLCTAVPSSAVYWAPKLVNSPTAAEMLESWEPESDIRMVTYRLRRTVDEDGVEHIEGLEREALRTLLAKTEEEGRTVESTLVSEQVKFFCVRYWDGTAWAKSWSGSGLPSAVRIDLGAEPLPEEMDPADYPYETAWRIIALPTAEASAALGGGRGADGAAEGDFDEDAPSDEDATDTGSGAAPAGTGSGGARGGAGPAGGQPSGGGPMP